MSLRDIVAALGGDLYQGGQRANVPAPGHSAADRSVSLLLENGRVVVHSFGAADWRTVLADLRGRGLVDAEARCAASSDAGRRAVARPDLPLRLSTARTLWAGGFTPDRHGLVARHLAARHIPWPTDLEDLREHPCAPLAVYQPTGRACRAMMAGVRDPGGAITAVELTYLTPAGTIPPDLRLPRKTVGLVPPGAAVRLSPLSPRLLVAEGVATTLSAMHRFALPGWALLSAGNLARWRPPPGVDQVLVAADRGDAGETAARALGSALRDAGIGVDLRFPPAPFGDWNDAACARDGRKEEGRGGAPVGRG